MNNSFDNNKSKDINIFGNNYNQKKEYTIRYKIRNNHFIENNNYNEFQKANYKILKKDNYKSINTFQNRSEHKNIIPKPQIYRRSYSPLVKSKRVNINYNSLKIDNEEDYENKIKQLYDMGFENRRLILNALKECTGNIQLTIEKLLNN